MILKLYKLLDEIRRNMNALARVSLVMFLTGCAASSEVEKMPVAPVVPANLSVTSAENLVTEAMASGVQIYTCSVSKKDPQHYEWVFTAPEADLYDRAGHRIGRHYAGPTWEASDGSKVVGQIKGREDGPDTNAIQWLLLKATSHAGNGLFSNTESIQRINTAAGKAPTYGCDHAQLGHEAKMDYRATYYFYAAKSN
jgi:hypothetical protein